MSIDTSGGDVAVVARTVCIGINENHPLIKLANILPWATLINLVVPDLKRTTVKGFWWMGRRILVRVHLATYILQKLYDLTDRQTEYGLKDNAAFQLFSGYGIVAGWHTLDHTKIQEFRSRLAPETQRALANILAKFAVDIGFADASETDFDSTVQEANIAYLPEGHPERSEGPRQIHPDPSLRSGHSLRECLSAKTRNILPKGFGVDMKAIKVAARSYFFMSKNKDIDYRRTVFQELHRRVKRQMRPVVNICNTLDVQRLQGVPWNIRRAVNQIKTDGWRYLLDVGHFTRTHTLKAGKVLSFHTKAVACIMKGKVGKDKEFGRVFQLRRIKGNFLFVMASTSLRMNDKASFIPMLGEHAALFGEGVLQSASADKGYWQGKNQRELQLRGVAESGLQRPCNIKSREGLPRKEIQKRLKDCRAGIEALIGRTKQGGQSISGLPEIVLSGAKDLRQEGNGS